MGCEGAALVADPNGPEVPPTTEVPPNTPFVPPTGGENAPDACKGISVSAAPTALRRLTLEELRNSYRDVLADATLAPTLAPPTGPIITETEVEKLNLATAEMVAKRGHLTYLPCDAAGAFNAACADTFIAEFGKFAFRRPLTDTEKTWLRNDVYNAIRTAALSPAATFRESIDAVAQAVLQSPQVLYIREEGAVDSALPAGVRRLTGFERATRLSYLMWRTTPDAALLAAATDGRLDTAAGVRTEAERLLASPRAKAALRGFVSNWLQLDGNTHQSSLELAPKTASLFPMDSPTLRAAMREEVLSLFDSTVLAPGGSFKSLMTSPKAYVNRTLGQLYGVASPPANDTTFAWVDLNPAQRGGLFTRAAFLSLYAPQDRQSPIRRGVFLYREALCRPLGAPPANVNNAPFTFTDRPLTVREQVDARTSPAECQGCHKSINNLGYTLEGYDALGRHQTSEKGTFKGTAYDLPINSTGTPAGTDFDGPVQGGADLSAKLAESGQAHDCMARTWFEQANPRELTAADACSLQKLMQKFRQTDDMRELLLGLASDDSALFIQETP